MLRTAAPKKQLLEWSLHSSQSVVQFTSTHLTADCFKAKTTFTAANQISESWSFFMTSFEGHREKKECRKSKDISNI